MLPRAPTYHWNCSGSLPTESKLNGTGSERSSCDCGCLVIVGGVQEEVAPYTAASASRSHDRSAEPVGSWSKSQVENMTASTENVAFPPPIGSSEWRNPIVCPSSWVRTIGSLERSHMPRPPVLLNPTEWL